MCWPLIVAAALMVGGAAAKNKGNAAAEKARERAGVSELGRQDGIRSRQAQTFADALGNFEGNSQGSRQGALTDRRAGTVDEGVLSPVPAIDLSAGIEGSAPKVVKDSAAKSLAGAISRAREEGKALSKLQGYGDLFFDNAVNLNRSGITQNQLGDFSRGSADVLPLELEADNRKGAKTRRFGEFLSGAGQVLGSAYGAGQVGGATAAGGAAYSKPMTFPWSPVG